MLELYERDIDLLVVGDANPVVIIRGDELEPAFGGCERIVEEAALELGGAGSITACAAARLGLRTAIATCVGDDALGRFTIERLLEAAVDLEGIRVVEGAATGVGVLLCRPDGRAVLNARGALAALDATAVCGDMLRRARHVHVASPFAAPLMHDGLARLIRRARAAGASVSLDTGWDPQERWDALWRAAVTVDVLLSDAQEALRLAGCSELERAGAALAAAGPLVIVKCGPDGAVAFDGESVARAPAPPVSVVDSTGAGDSFNAGFLASWLSHAELPRALALGCACGALATRARGGTAAQPTRAEAEALAAA